MSYGFQRAPSLYAKIKVIKKGYIPRYETKHVISRVSKKNRVREMSYENWVWIMSDA